MELKFVKYGNLMGSPDCKEMLHRAGAGTAAAHAVWEEIFAIKAFLGLNGQSTSALLLESAHPEGFPAVVDLSYVTPTGNIDKPAEAALEALTALGVDAREVRTVLATHLHPDHYDRRLADFLPNARAIGPGLQPFSRERFGGLVDVMETPGHGGPHVSFLLDLPQLDLSVCLAGDLVMSHAHYLSLDHPLSFTDGAEGKKSVARIESALRARGHKHQVIVPGHDIPFFLV